MDRRKSSASDERWSRFMHPKSSSAEDLFEALRRAYMSFPTNEESEFVVCCPGSKIHDALYISANVEASTVTGSSGAMSRTSSHSSFGSTCNVSVEGIPSHNVFNAVFSSGLACGLGPMLLSRGTYLDRIPSVSNAFAIGCLTSSAKILFIKTPIFGDLSSLAVLATIQRSRMHRSGEVSSRVLNSNISGFMGSLIGLRLAERIQSHRDDRQWMKMIISISCSFAGNYLGRNLAEFYYGNK